MFSSNNGEDGLHRHHHQRPHSLFSGHQSQGSGSTEGNLGLKGAGSSQNSNRTGGSGGGRSRWLLCYPSANADTSESPSSPSESESNLSTPSPTDHGFKIPNSYSNERPTSLPVALQVRNNDPAATNGGHPMAQQQIIDPLSIDPNEQVTPGQFPNPTVSVVLSVSDIGVIPPPPMFCGDVPASPSHMIPMTVVDEEELNSEPEDDYEGDAHDEVDRLHDIAEDDGADEEDDGDEEAYESLDDRLSFDSRLIQTVPAKEPHFDAMPLKSALKKSNGAGPAAVGKQSCGARHAMPESTTHINGNTAQR